MRFDEVTLAARRPQELLRFYARLGFVVEAGAARIGHTRLRFVERPPTGAVHLAFKVAEHRFADAKAWIRRHAPLLTTDGGDEVHFESWNAHALYFLDPEENVLELIARHDVPSAFAGPFGPDGVEGVSEIGLPVEDVRAAVAKLCAQLGETPWKPASDTFGTVGDEHGLLIVVPAGRPWFPSMTAARGAPLAVEIERGRTFRP